jgi:hypothetical protein
VVLKRGGYFGDHLHMVDDNGNPHPFADVLSRSDRVLAPNLLRAQRVTFRCFNAGLVRRGWRRARTQCPTSSTCRRISLCQGSTPEASRTPPFGFRVSQQNAIVRADSWSSGECRLRGREWRNLLENQVARNPARGGGRARAVAGRAASSRRSLYR